MIAGKFWLRIALGLQVGAIPAAGAVAAAQDAGSASGQEIVVEAPRRLAPPHRANRFRGETELVAKVRVSVIYSDLDLGDPKQAARLMARIGRTARQACGYLDDLYPLQRDPQCVGRAIADAVPAANAAIAAARK